MPEPDNVTKILLQLDAGRQRATYSAIAGLADHSARSVMHGRLKNPLHSWIVSKSTHQPTGYAEENKHPELLTHDHVIETADELAAWLDRRP